MAKGIVDAMRAQSQAKQLVQSGIRTAEELEPYCRLLEGELGRARMLNQILTSTRQFKVLSYPELEVEWKSKIADVFPAFDVIYIQIDGQSLAKEMGLTGSLQFLHKALKCVRSSEYVAQSQDGSAVILIVMGRIAKIVQERVMARLNAEGVNVVAASGQCMDADLGVCLKPMIEEVEGKLRGGMGQL